MDEIRDFDLHAAWIRRAQTDLHAFLEALATRLEGALPGRVQVERKRDGLLSATRHVIAITIQVDGSRYLLDAHDHDVRASRQHEVRGVVLKTESLPLDRWLQDLEDELRRLSGSLEGARGILQDFLTS
ncbi:MAG: hypothetical protein M0Z85_00730 [Gammaproteobacteria bacterium]|jgi:hypothetical protein|uniref:hypothetical protein n=1 Tax=Acidiferrobacter sp. SPIII_3 TaxID=1281578 RepID=UPI000D733117|nr:hypothetical protein [Acidiferrobacter sp. SPIII_3]AWP25104.1 hypothetical protein C4901_16935 [Acidiferrobacter sp. SPIII_3]MDA8118586.1 hypothetical protein [Gammaproteobacteria bacterium]